MISTQNILPYSDRAYSEARKLIDEANIQEALQTNSERCVVGSSPKIRVVFDLIRKYAVCDAPVLITGETGTGKELIAHAIHARSARAHGPFKVINCAAIPPSLIASELFGYEKGAFTGATARKKGIIEAAEGGTLFLDEVGHLPPDMQGYLLRVLQEKTIQTVGGVDQIPVNARIISATNVDFGNCIESGTFRSDLFFRLKVLTIHMPPLRDRGDDVLTLALFYLRKFAAELGREKLDFTPAAERALLAYRWPGNIRELMSCIQRAVVVCDNDTIDACDLDDIPDPVATETAGSFTRLESLLPARKKLSIHEQRTQLMDAIRACDGNLTQAADHLQISRMTIYRLVRRHRIDEEIQSIRSNHRS